MIAAWLGAFALTQIVETPIYARALSARCPRWTVRVALAFGASALTHPAVFFVFPRLFPGDYWTGVAAAELFAVSAEALYLRRLGVDRAIGWSLLANAASVTLGLVSRAVFQWP